MGATCCNREDPKDYIIKEINCLDFPENDYKVAVDYTREPNSKQEDNDDIIFNHVASTLKSPKEEINVTLNSF